MYPGREECREEIGGEEIGEPPNKNILCEKTIFQQKKKLYILYLKKIPQGKFFVKFQA